jgi:hypothetical protein
MSLLSKAELSMERQGILAYERVAKQAAKGVQKDAAEKAARDALKLSGGVRGPGRLDRPTDLIKGLSGTFDGTMVMLDPELKQTAAQNVTDIHTIEGPTKFSADIRYTDPTTHQETRRQSFTGEWDPVNKVFNLVGDIMKGIMQIVSPGHYVLSFDTTINGTVTHAVETVSLSQEESKMVRTLQYFSGGVDGPPTGVRVTQEARVPSK